MAKCQPGQCSNGLVCDLDSGRCVSPGSVTCEPAPEACNRADDDCNGVTDEGCGVAPVAAPAVSSLDLGVLTTGGGGLSHEATVTVPADALSLTLVALGADDSYLMFWSLVDPSGLGLLKGTDIYASLNRTYPGQGATALLVPNNPGVTLAPGKHRFSLYKEGDVGPVQVAALFKAGPDTGAGKLGLNLYFVGLPWMNAAKAQSDGTFQKIVQRVGSIYAQVGITIDDVTYADIGGSEGQAYRYLDLDDGPGDERQALLKLSGLRPDSPNVNVFFVQDIVRAEGYSGYYDVLGIAGGIPGPPLFQGTAGAGVVVDLSDLQEGWYSSDDKVAIFGEVIAHEVGHQLGLYHTSEQDGDTHDQRGDTQACTQDTNNDGLVDGWECWNQGAKNLMFWQATGAVTLSTQQGWVLRRNPAIR